MSKPVAVITGASSGIGKACAEVFAAKGYTVVICARNQEKLDKVAAQLRGKGYTILEVIADISKEDDCKRLIDETISHYQRIDVLINNAGLSMRGLFEHTDLEVLRKLMDTNFWGTVYCTKYALPHLLKQHGSVVGVSSIAGKKGLPGRTGYSASKFAMEGFLDTLRTENLKKGLHVLVACPGFTATDIRNSSLNANGSEQGESPRDEKTMMSSDTVALHIFNAVRARKRDLVLTREGKLTILLNKFMPGILDRMVYNHMAKEPGSPFQ
jgi:dehydrogenase/reductase SDR family protein 7B